MKYIRANSLIGDIRQTATGYGLKLAVLSLFGAVTISASAGALTTISQGYTTDKTLSLGALVSLKRDTSDQIELAAISNVDNLFGVVIENESSLLSVSNGKPNQVQIATTGTVPVLVSDINGAIKRGDHITASPIAGVGMKANGNVRVIGVAQTDMGAGKKQTYKDKSGKEQSVNLGEVTALVNVAYFFKEPDKTLIPTSIQNIANSLAGRTVSSVPILVSAGIFLITIIIVCAIIYSMIHSSIISVGRNPMSQSAIYRDLIQLSSLVLAILSVGLIAIYLVLTKL